MPETIQFWTMIIEETLIIIHYASITLINKLNQISVLVIWIIINIFMISLFMDFVDFIIDYWKQTYANEKRESNKFYRMIRSIWDHDISTKSLAETIDWYFINIYNHFIILLFIFYLFSLAFTYPNIVSFIFYFFSSYTFCNFDILASIFYFSPLKLY